MCAVPICKEHRELRPADLIQLFLLYKAACGLSEKTMKDYGYHLAKFFRLYPDALDFPRERTMEYLAGYSNPTSFNLRYSYLRCFWNWCADEGYFRGSRHPLDGIKKKRPQGRVIDIPESELKRLLRQPNQKTFAGFRDFVLMNLQLDTAIRPGEGLHLLPDDLRADRSEIEVRACVSKTRVARTLPVSESTVLLMKRLLLMHHPSWKDATIFCTETGGPFKETSYGHAFKKYSTASKVKATPYALRHCAALLMLRNGVSAFTLASIMGHADLSMTRRYLAISNTDKHREHAAAGVMRLLNDEPPRPARVRTIGKP
ncbi:MAG: site-specific integrase [Clostridia bacterium]|nr:site-specific integrase [Clostridia bacterium]